MIVSLIRYFYDERAFACHFMMQIKAFSRQPGIWALSFQGQGVLFGDSSGQQPGPHWAGEGSASRPLRPEGQ